MVDDGGSNDTESVDLSDRRVWEVYVSRYSWNLPQVADVGGRAGLGSVGDWRPWPPTSYSARVFTPIRSRYHLGRSR